MAVDFWWEACDDGGKDGVCADEASSAEHERFLPTDGIEDQDDEAAIARQLRENMPSETKSVQDVGNRPDSAVDTLNQQCLAGR